MLAEKNESIAEATETVYKLSEEEKIRLQCEAREDYYRCQRDAQILRERAERREREALERLNDVQRQIEEAEQREQELETVNKKQAEQINQLTAELEKLRARETK